MDPQHSASTGEPSYVYDDDARTWRVQEPGQPPRVLRAIAGGTPAQASTAFNYTHLWQVRAYQRSASASWQGALAAASHLYWRQTAKDVDVPPPPADPLLSPLPPRPLSLPPPPAAAFRALYYHAPATDLGAVDASHNIRVIVYPDALRPPSLYQYLFNSATDVPAAAEPETLLSWTPRPLQRPAVPPLRAAFQGYYFSSVPSDVPPTVEPDVPQSWTPRPLAQPQFPSSRLPYWANTAQDTSVPTEPETLPAWVPRPLRLQIVPPGVFLLLYYSGAPRDTDAPVPTVETLLGWVPTPLRVARLPRGTPYYYFSSTVPEQNAEDPQSWAPAPLRVPRVPLGAFFEYYYSNTAQDTSVAVVTDTPVPWVGRPLPTHWAFPYGLYQWNTAQDASAPAPAPGVPEVSVQPPWLRRLRLMSQQRPGR